MPNDMKTIVLALAGLFAASAVNAQTIAGYAGKTYNTIPRNESTSIQFGLLGTNRLAASTTTNITVNPFELPAGRDVGLLVNGFIVTNNAQFTINYRLSPDGVNWTWPPQSVSSGVVASNTTPAYSVMLVLSNAVTYPARYWRLHSITTGTNSLFVSNAVYFYKNNQ